MIAAPEVILSARGRARRLGVLKYVARLHAGIAKSFPLAGSGENAELW